MNTVVSDKASDVSDTEEEVIEGISDEDVDIAAAADVSGVMDPEYKAVWTGNAPQYGVSNINFTGNPGVNNELVENNVPLDLFELMFTDVNM